MKKTQDKVAEALRANLIRRKSKKVFDKNAVEENNKIQNQTENSNQTIKDSKKQNTS